MINIMKFFESGIVWEWFILIKLMKFKINFIWYYYLNLFKLLIIFLLEKIKIVIYLLLLLFWILNIGKRGFLDFVMYCFLDFIGGLFGILVKILVFGK